MRPHIYFGLEIGGKIAARTKPRLCYTFSFALRTLDRGPHCGCSGQNKDSGVAVALGGGGVGGQAWCLRSAGAVLLAVAPPRSHSCVCVNAWRKMCEDVRKQIEE